ncbi:hypothetical protein EDEG_02780 [Edhazardia aedis USNM 41457]|uniref:GOLD domain-containing protein n=1 Tax=Edhazardia aedis (strain USNM 41457) TaxID=1003232 RepID=J9D5L8_EDHAE|nr:hypothetical protein EDEG_02780 [Edhazardia aedis USNM 41457]|eukprot:EJW02839.1 hypothetical protein EDEG_02780 [Edhazardia aedis USNM 41457]
MFLSLFLQIVGIASIIVPYRDGIDFQPIRKLHKSTVVLFEAKWIVYSTKGIGSIKELEKVDWLTTIDIFGSPNSSWDKIHKDGTLASERVESGPKNNALFTATYSGLYLFQFGLKKEDHVVLPPNLALEINIYVGRQSDPRIVSQADTQLRDIYNKVYALNELNRNIEEIIKEGGAKDVEYKRNISKMMYVEVLFILFKLFVFYCMFFYFNRRLCQFYTSKKIAVN